MKTIICLFILTLPIMGQGQTREKTSNGFTIEDHRVYIHVDTINNRAGVTIYMRGYHYANITSGTCRTFKMNMRM